MKPTIELILFDLGGVLVELGEHLVPPRWLADKSDFRLNEWFSSPTAHAFEKGEIGADKFAASLIDELNLSVSCDELIEVFTSWPKGLAPNAHTLLERLSQNFRLAVLSNSNELHWPRMQTEFGLNKYFEKMYSSHLMGAIKPSSQAFQTVLDDLDVAPRQVLFFDDNVVNIQAARDIGVVAVHAKGLQMVEDYCFSLLYSHQG